MTILAILFYTPYMRSLEIIDQFRELSYTQQRDLLSQLQKTLSFSRPILEHKVLDGCPYCGNIKLYRHSSYKNGGSRFKCVECKKTFNELTGTSIHGIHKKELLDGFVRLMLESKTIRQISKELNLSKQTVQNWRHKILTSFNELFTKEFKGIVETDDTYFRFNEKGCRNTINSGRKLRGISNQQVSVMVTMDRYKTIDLRVVKLGRITKSSLKSKLNLDRFNKSNIIYSDNSRIVKNLFKDLDIQHETFVAKNKFNGSVHVQNVNNFTRRLKDWIKLNFNNVSTKYLHNYLNWFMMLEILKNTKNQEDNFWNYLLDSNSSYKMFNEIEGNYNNLLLTQ